MKLNSLNMISVCAFYTVSILTGTAVHAAGTPQGAEAPRLSAATIEKNMEQAESLIRKGEKLIRGAEEDLEDAHDKISKGESLVAKGKETARDSRNQYRVLANDAGQARNPDEVFAEAKKFDKLADRWEDALDDVEDGEKLIKKGNKESQKAESRINEGRSLVASGKKLRSDTERSLDRLAAPTAISTNDPEVNAKTVR